MKISSSAKFAECMQNCHTLAEYFTYIFNNNNLKLSFDELNILMLRVN